MTKFGNAVLTLADGERKVIGSKVHAFIATHPFIAAALLFGAGLVVGIVLRGL